MTTILSKIKKKSIEIRKAKSLLAAYSTFVLSEITKVGKAKGDRETTDDEAITVLKKMLTVAESNLALVTLDKNSTLVEAEIEFLKSFLPSEIDETEMMKFITENFPGPEKYNKGVVFKKAKEKYGSLINMMKFGVLAENAGRV